MRAAICIALALAGLLGACRIPEDPDGTLDRVQGGVMRVGITESDPWVALDGDVPTGGVEVALVRRFARELQARVEWVDGGEEELIAALKEGSLDLVVGGLTSKSRWKKDAAFTRPYVKTRTVVGVPPESLPPDDLDDDIVVVPVRQIDVPSPGTDAPARGTDAPSPAAPRAADLPSSAAESESDSDRLRT